MPRINEIIKYQQFVDGLVKRSDCVLINWIHSQGWPKLPENERINALLSKLSPDEKEIVAKIASEARDGGIHDTLVYLQEQMDIENLRLVFNGQELPVSPFDTEIYWDWIARRNGVDWPETVANE